MARGLTWTAEDCPPELGLDEACFRVFNKRNSTIELFEQLDECYTSGCECFPWKQLPAGSNASLLVNSAYPLHFYYYSKETLQVCHETFRFNEHKTFTWNATQDSLCTHVDPAVSFDADHWLPLAAVVISLCIILGIWARATRWFYLQFELPSVPYSNIISVNDLNIQPEVINRETSSTAASPPRRNGSRVASLDVFRGICIAMMIFVNYGGGGYRIFKHAPWNGLTFADLVFPWFLWVMGVSLVLSLRSQFRNDRSRITVWLLVTRRSIILIAIGLILNSQGHNDLSHYRIPGVLQRIGLAYFIIASIETCIMNPGGPFQSRICEDIIYGWIQTLFASLLALVWTVVTFVVDVPGCGRGYLGPGGMEKHGRYANCTGGVAGYIDRAVFTPQHLYQHPTSEKVFKSTQPYDPEGLLGTLTAALLVHMGAHAGRILLCYSHTNGRLYRWLIWGTVMCLSAGALCRFTLTEGYIPINKNLFSLSYVLFTGGAAFIVLTILYFLIDSIEVWDGSPFSYAGNNAILLYIGHELVRGFFPWSWKPIWGNHLELLIMNVWATILWLFIAYVLEVKDIKLAL